MDKREFLKTTGALVAGSVLSRVAPGQKGSSPRTNWSGNLTFSTNRLHAPESVEELQKIVKSCEKARLLGIGHSFNAIADSTYDQISLEHLDHIELDEAARTVTVGGGVTYAQLSPWLDERGYALHNLASLPRITVAGACSTGTHGSGLHNGNLPTAVAAIEFVTADGGLATLSREKDGDHFRGAVVALGTMGAVTRVTLNVQPTYKVAQSVYRNMSFDELGRHFNEIFASGYSVSVFTDWDAELFGAKLATEKLHPLAGHSAESCTEQEGVPGAWYDRLPHFRIGQTPSSGLELQSEYFVPFDRGFQAVLAVEKLHEQVTPHLFITELRTIAADDLWMSMAYQRPSLSIHFTWKPEWPAVRQLLPQIEAQLKPFHPRPHWGKLFTLPAAQIQASYSRLQDFRALAGHYDPHGKFRNRFVNENLYSA
jgi:xylitol oxidase